MVRVFNAMVRGFNAMVLDLNAMMLVENDMPELSVMKGQGHSMKKDSSITFKSRIT